MKSNYTLFYKRISQFSLKLAVLKYSSKAQRHAKQFENFSSDPIGNENRAAAIEKHVTVDISTQARFCMQDTVDNS